MALSSIREPPVTNLPVSVLGLEDLKNPGKMIWHDRRIKKGQKSIHIPQLCQLQVFSSVFKLESGLLCRLSGQAMKKKTRFQKGKPQGTMNELINLPMPSAGKAEAAGIELPERNKLWELIRRQQRRVINKSLGLRDL